MEHPFIVEESSYNYDITSGMKIEMSRFYSGQMHNKSEEHKNNEKKFISSEDNIKGVRNRSKDEIQRVKDNKNHNNKKPINDNKTSIKNNTDNNTRSDSNNPIKQQSSNNNLFSVNISQNNNNNNYHIKSNGNSSSHNISRNLSENLPKDVKKNTSNNSHDDNKILSINMNQINNNTNSPDAFKGDKAIYTNNDTIDKDKDPTPIINRSNKRRNTGVIQNTSQNNISENQVEILIGEFNEEKQDKIVKNGIGDEVSKNREDKTNMNIVNIINRKMDIDKENIKEFTTGTTSTLNNIRLMSNHTNNLYSYEDEFISKEKSENNHKKVLVKIPRKSKAITDYLQNLKK